MADKTRIDLMGMSENILIAPAETVRPDSAEERTILRWLECWHHEKNPATWRCRHCGCPWEVVVRWRL